uniref:Uncharacterized protein n=1 Tax=Anopheles minimus TaxID=112268 RepID=A0A182WPI9_9DIPT
MSARLTHNRATPKKSKSSGQRNNDPGKIIYGPDKFEDRPAHFSAVLVTKPIELQLTYNRNMARDFKPPMTGKDAKRRETNKFSLRIFRAKQLALAKLLLTQTAEAAEENQHLKLYTAQQCVYVKALRQLLGMAEPESNTQSKK